MNYYPQRLPVLLILCTLLRVQSPAQVKRMSLNYLRLQGPDQKMTDLKVRTVRSAAQCDPTGHNFLHSTLITLFEMLLLLL